MTGSEPADRVAEGLPDPWDEHRLQQLRRGLALSYAERLDWLVRTTAMLRDMQRAAGVPEAPPRPWEDPKLWT